MAIRLAGERDLPRMLELYRPYVEQTTYSFEYDVPCLRTFTQRFLDHTAQFPWLVWEEEGTVLGYAYAGAPWERAAYRWSAEVSIYLAPRAQGKGVGRRLYRCLEEILTAQGYRMVYAIITSENEGSIAFHRAMGYRKRAEFPDCGYKHGRWLGVSWMDKELRGEFQPSGFPRNWRDPALNLEEILEKTGENHG